MELSARESRFTTPGTAACASHLILKEREKRNSSRLHAGKRALHLRQRVHDPLDANRSCTSRFAPSATRSIPASRSWSTPVDASSASSAALPRAAPAASGITAANGREVPARCLSRFPSHDEHRAHRNRLSRHSAVDDEAGLEVRLSDGRLMPIRDAPVGGQAVLEGVMMRGVSHWAVAVREPADRLAATPADGSRSTEPRRTVAPSRSTPTAIRSGRSCPPRELRLQDQAASLLPPAGRARRGRARRSRSRSA